jgi:hypothetical protein
MPATAAPPNKKITKRTQERHLYPLPLPAYGAATVRERVSGQQPGRSARSQSVLP